MNNEMKFESFYRLKDDGNKAYYIIADKDYNYMRAINRHKFFDSKIKESLHNKKFDYNIIIVKVNQKKTNEFEEIAAEVARNLTIINGKNFLEFKEYMNTIINRMEGGD